MAFPITWDITKPDGSEAPGTLDDILRTQVKTPLDTLFAATYQDYKASAQFIIGTARITGATYANIPVAGNEGAVFYATDTVQLFWDNGSAWVEIVLGARWAELLLMANFEKATSNQYQTTNYATLPYGVSWASGQGILVTTSNYPATAQFSLHVLANMVAHAGSFQLYDATAAAAVTGSEIVGTTAGLYHLASSSFSLTAGSHRLRVQAKTNSGTTVSWVFQATLQVSW